MEYRQEQEVQTLLKELVIMRAKISKLLKQANDGLEIIEEAKVQVAIQAKEIEENKEKIAKLDKWLETINNGLKETVQHSEVLTEEDIIRYIEIYDRYLIEYEEYETIMKSITVISQDETSQSLKLKLVAMQKALMETKNLVNIEIERLRQVLLQIKSAPEVVDDDISQTDRTIDSTSMPEEVVSPRDIIKEKEVSEKVPSVKLPSPEESVKVTVQESKPSHEKPEPVQMQVVKETVAIETQTGKSLMSEPPSVSDKSVICQPEAKVTHDVSITCAPPVEMAIQTSEPHSEAKEILENIQVRQTISDGHETIEIASRPVIREQKLDEKSLLVDANYKDDNFRKDSQLNITHSLPQSFETVMVEPDETTTEVVVDADGTKRIIVKKVRKTLVTRQQILQSQQHESHILSSDLPLDQAYSQIVIRDEKAGTSTTLGEGEVQHMEYQTYGGQVITSLPGGEVTIQEFTSKPDMKITMERDMNPEQILLLAEGQELPQVQTSTSSVTAVVQQVTKRIVKTRRRIIRRVVIIDGKEHVTEEIVEEPDNVEVVEEQIPRVSINVRERGDIQPSGGEDDDDRRDDHPALPPRKDDDSSKDDRPKHDKPDGKPFEDRPHDDKPKDEKPDDTDSQQVDAPVELTQAQQLEKMMQDFIQKEGTTHRTITKSTTRVQTSQERESSPEEFIQKDGTTHHTITKSTTTRVQSSQERESTPVKTVTVSESFEILPGQPDETTYIVQEPHDEDGHTTLITEGTHHSTFESSSTNVATVVQKVTRKITRTRRRIIKHITIIDGKEHVTEEVIEEPDDVEVIEEEPQISHSIQTEGVKTKRIRIIKQVQIIDGKEHVTEQIVEEPDDEYVPDSTITTDIDVKLNKPEALEIIQEDDVKSEFPTITKSTTVTVMPTQKDTTIIDVTKGFIGSEIEHVAGTVPEIKQTIITREITPDSSKKPSDDTNTTVKIVKETVQFNEPEVTTSTITTKETDGFTTTTVTRHVTSEFTTVTSSDTPKDTSLIDITKSLISSEMEHTAEDISKKPKEPAKDAPVKSEPVKDVPVKSEPTTVVPEETESFEKVPIKSEPVKDAPVKSEPIEEVPVKTEQITVVKETEIVKSEPVKELPVKSEPTKDAPVKSEPVKEEPVKFDSPDATVITKTVTVTTPVDETKTTTIVTSEVTQKETVGTPEPVLPKDSKDKKRPAKEPVSKEKTQEPETVMQIIQETVQSTEPEITITKKTTEVSKVTDIISDAPIITETITKTVTTEIPETNGIKDTTLVDITKSLIESETDHSVVSKIPASPVKIVTKTEEIKQVPLAEPEALKEPKQVKPVDEKLSKPEELKPTVTVEVKLTEQRLPAKDVSPDKGVVVETSAKQPQEVTDTTITTQKDSSLYDITKSFIGTEIDHSAIHKTPTKPKKDELIPQQKEEIDHSPKPTTPKPEKDVPIPEKEEIVKSPEGEKVKDSETVTTTTTHKTITTTTSVQEKKPTVETIVTKTPEIVTIVKETIEVEPETIGTTEDIFVPEPEMAQALEVTDVTPASTVDVPKDTGLLDLTKSFIGSEMDHTVVSKIPAMPIKREESLEMAVEAIEEPQTPETLAPVKEAAIPETVTTTKLPEQVDIVDERVVLKEEKPEISKEDQKIVETLKKPEKEKLSEKKPKDDSVQFITQEITEQQGVTQFNVTEITRELLEKESIHAGTIHSPVKVEEKHKAIPSDVPKDYSEVTQVTQVSTSTTIEPKEPVKPKEPVEPDEPTSTVSISIKEQPLPQKEEIVSVVTKDVIKSEEPVPKEPEVVEQPSIPVVEDVKPTSPERDFPEVEIDQQPKIGIVKLIKEFITQEGTDKYERIPVTTKTEVDTTVSQSEVTQVSTSTTIEPKEPVQPDEPTSTVSISIKEQPLPKKEEIVSVVTKEVIKSEEPVPKEPEVIEQPSIPVVEDVKPIFPERDFPEVEIGQEPKIGVVSLIKEFITQEGTDKYERIAEPTKTGVEKIVSQITTEKAPTQSTIEVEPLKIGTVISEADVTEVPAAPEMSYIRQFEPQIQGSSDSVNKLMMTFGQPEKQDVPSQTTELPGFTQPQPDRPGTKYDVSMLLHSERQDTDIRGFKPEPKVTQLDKPEQTVDISLSLTKSREADKVKPEVQYDLKVQHFETEPIVVKKDVEVILPSEVKITKEKATVPIADVVSEEPKAEVTPPESVKQSKKSRRKKKHKTDSITSESTEIETDKSIAGTDSSSLSHYVELPVSPPRESPTPTEDVLEPVVVAEVEPEPKEPTPVIKSATPEPEKIKTPEEPVLEEPQAPEIEDSYVESESLTISEEKGYEPEDLSLGPVPTTESKKKHKKRKPHRESEETAYPVITTTETDETTVTTPVEMREPGKKGRDKRRKKKTPVEPVKSPSEPDVEPEPVVEPEPEVKPESPKLGTEVEASSPKEESYHTISETSDITTVKIVEECVQSSPETAEREVGTILKFPVPIVEEIATTEYSVQTSPEEPEPVEEIPRPETSDIEMQTTPTSMSEVITQTTPVKDKEAHTQTVEEVVTVVEKIMSDTEIQTSRSETPEQVVQLEATTQVIPHDISTPEEKFSQTSPVVEEPVVVEEKSVTPEIITESREMQTSPLPMVQKDEKSTEIIVETTETDIQTVQKEITEQGTSTTPIKEKELTEMGMQTPEVPLVSTFTQSDTPEPEPVKEVQPLPVEIPEVPSLPSLEIKEEVITVDSTQQTTPREEVEPPKPEVKVIETVNTSQQTTPREPEPVVQEVPELPEKSISPEPTPVVEPVIEPAVEPTRKIITVDSTQQTSPRSPPVELAPTPIPPLDLERRDVITIDSTQQTSPRNYSEDSISTSTDEPYEIHLKAQISIPQATTEFIESERSFEEPPQSILGEKYKQKRRRTKKKTESPLLQSPESLSDPINTELSLSVTPTSEDMSLKDASSIDEGISQLASPMTSKQTLHKLTYSDVVQRSKSKSPSPSKTIIPRKSEKARLLDALEKRTQSVTEPQKTIPDDSMTVALLEPSVEKSYNLVVNKELDEVKNSIENNDPTRTERSVIIVIETISIWLEEIQYKIQRQTISGVKSTEETERLNTLKKHVHDLKHIIEVTEVSEEIITLIETLTRQVDAVNTLNSQSSVKVKEVEKEWIKFLEDTDKLSYSVEAVKNNLDDVIMSELPTQQKLEKLDKIETNNLDNFVTIRKMFKRCRSLVEANPKRECPSKLYNAEDDTKQIENTINTERDRLLQLASLAEEYEQTLQDFGQITDVAEALLDGKIIVSDLDHLHEEIQKHRKFFVNLSHCRAILESLEDNLDSETRAKFSSLHNSLHDRATIIIDRAASRAQQMTLAASRWSLLQHGMKEERQWLIVAQQRVPDLSNVTSRDHEQYINLYQSISLDVSHHYAKMLRLLSITESLQNLIVCSGLESECSVALDTLLKLQDDVDSRLTRLTAFKENWVTYDLLIDRIEGWMKVANRELEFITPENITTTGNLRRFWELKAQHEVHNNLKNESGVQFEKALEILPVSDEMVQRQFFSKIEDKWSELAAKIDSIHSSAIQNISDRDVSSGEKLNILEEELRELRAALESLKGVIKSEDELNLYIERLQVMTGRIDRIQNELGRLSLLPTAESDRLGALLTQSGILDDQISEELERSMLLKEKIVQVQAGIIRCQKSQRRARLTLEECEAAERLGSDVVERASENCDKLIDELGSQWRDILALRQALHTLPTSLRVVVSPTGVERDISALQETHAELEAACSDLSTRLRAKLLLWRRFERQLELVQGAVREADYMVELLTVQGQVDYDRLLKATEKLENLSESLSRRSGELVGELTAAAAPLAASSEPAVAASLRRDLDDAAAAYEHTCTNLNQLCDKYHKAVELWKRYRDAAAAVRAFADFQESKIHALRPDDAPNTAQACLEQEARVAELRSLAAQVAAETGSRALQADADALARRLQLVAGAVQALADLGEARQLARAKAQHAKEMLCDMRQDLTPVHEDGEIVEDKLIALRDNLIALGKSEADIAPAKAELPDIDRDVSDEHSIVRILELWQAMFRDTFLHYHRLSTALVRSGDAATALRLWHEYLIDLQSFLSGSVPADYENLTEHRRLCRVHKNLLTSQRSVLMNENRETRNRELADKFDTLTNLHNETLARIVERHDEVCTRIAAWDDYREVYTELLRWLKEMEREKEKLQLRYVHIKRIQKILAKIQNLSDKVPEGRRQSDKLLSDLKKVLEFTEEAYGASVRMEYAGIVKRVDNLQASLDTWRDFLNRILGLINEYENLTNNELHKLYSKTQDEIMSYSDEDRLSRPQLKKAVEKYSELRTKIVKTETQIETLSVIQEQLKECLSPQDIRLVNQRVWQLRQQRADLEHQLSIIIHRLQERLEIYTIFESRLTRFVEWITTLETRLEASSQSTEIGAIDPQDLIRRINSEVQAETALKEREFEWLTETGLSLVELSKKDEKSYSKTTSKQLKDVQERWHKMQETGRSRIAKINELLETISQLEQRLTDIRLKLHSIESNLSTSVVLEYLTTKAVDEKFKDRDDIHKNIENESGEVGETLNLCELVFNDPDVLKGNFDLRNLHTGVDIVEKKWKNICEMSEQRKNALKEIRKSAELANSLLPKVEKKLDSVERRVEKIETRKQRGEPEDESVSKAVIKDLESVEGDVKRLEDAYSRIASARGVELRGAAADEAARLRAAVRRWQLLGARLHAAGADAHRQLVAAHGRAVVALAEADVRLTRALHLAPTPLDKAATLKELDGVEQELLECQTLVEDADRLAAAVSTVAGVSDMVAEYRALFADVRTRLDLARAEVVGDVDSAVQVDTLKWETDAALQVDTLTSKETYRAELATAVKETSEALEALRLALDTQPNEKASSDELATAAKEIAKAGAKPGQTLELAKHLSELLLTECDATEDEAMLKEVESLSLTYEDLLSQAKKRELQINNLRLPHSASYALTCEHESGRLTCPLCSERNWKQLDNDLWRLEQWLQFAEATDEARTGPPEQYDALEDVIQDHREFLLDLDSHKSIVVSLNVVGTHVAAHARSAAAAERVRARLAAANLRWDTACRRAHDWQARLQRALLHNRQFHDILVDLVAKLAAAEKTVRAREPLRLGREPAELQRDFRRFAELRDELRRAEPRVLALHEAAALLAPGPGPHARLAELRLRLQSLRKLCSVYALKLGAALARRPARSTHALAAAAATLAPQLMEEDEEELSGLTLPPLDETQTVVEEEEESGEDGALFGMGRSLRFICRVARASLPFQALLLLLLGAAALAPHGGQDCRSRPLLDPVLRYPDGPPPL